MKRIVTTLAAAGLVAAFAAPSSAYEAFHGPLGVLQNNPGATDGYVLIAPQDSKSVYLIDNDGNVVNEWKSEYNNFYAELLPNGNMVKHARIPDAKPGVFGGTSGLVEEFDWNGKKVWEYKMYTPGKEVSHHTFEVMPNGNMLLLGWEYKSYDDAVAKGMDPKVIGSFALAFTVGCFAGKMACGRLVGIFGSRKVFITSKLLMSALLAVLVTAQGLPVIIVTSILLGIVTKGTVPVLQTLLVEPVTDPQAYDDLFAFNTFARGSTNILTPLLFGFIASAFSAEYIYVLMAIVSVFAVAPVLFGRPMRA